MIDPLDIVVYHVGGEGNCGPVEQVLRRYPDNSLLVMFEARDDSSEFSMTSADSWKDRKLVVNRCIGGAEGSAKFFSNKFPMSSSLLPPAPSAMSEHVAYEHCHTWGENTELEKEYTIKITTIDAFLSEGIAPPPDVLSVDAQGAEIAIMQGAKNAFSSIVSVVSEVEFSEIYLGQGLFDHQMAFLRDHNIRLADIVNHQYWYPDVAIGDGLLTVGEAIWLRTIDSINDFLKLAKLGAVALAFNRRSTAYSIAKRLQERFPAEFSLHRQHPFCRDLLAVKDYVARNLDNYRKNNHFFLPAPKVSLMRRTFRSLPPSVRLPIRSFLARTGLAPWPS